ncbi:copper transport protein [Agyrium rufum]|nr:copper transport protein [Agyrium rufum]
MATQERPEVRHDVKAAKVNLKLVLAFTEGLFRHRKTMTETAWEKTADSCKKILRKSQKEPETRLCLGTSLEIWTDFTACFAQALPVLEFQSFVTEATTVECGGVSSTLMALNHATLMKDLERLNDLLTIARNMLATTVKAQNLAAEAGFDVQILKYIDTCVRVTARGYDGTAGARTEGQWDNVVGAYKKLLITCLQFLHNLVMHNEPRKLLLWLDLFGSSKAADTCLSGGFNDHASSLWSGKEGIQGSGEVTNRVRAGILSNEDLNMALTALKGSDAAPGIFTPDEAARFASEVMKTVDGFVNMTIGQHVPGGRKGLSSDASKGEVALANEDAATGQPPKQAWNWANIADSIFYADPRSTEIKEDDTKIGRTPESAAEALKEAKQQLMNRLAETAGFALDAQDRLAADNLDIFDAEEEIEGDGHASDVAADGSVEPDEEEEEEEEDYHGPGDQERGLLTDIPLVLGPQEIEALPMIIQAGIYNGRTPKNPAEARELQNMQAVRCNILLAQESGRNLLRELLIFIAAWDLQEDEFYFKLMMQIMEAILQNGLMPFAYQTFGEVKDIVSPAQSIVIKILTQIFRKKQASGTSNPAPRSEPPTRVELLIVRYIFTVFRQSIIPETCALIYLQGQIRLGVALPEDFPLNLWDMERVYEGIYQFLEFFAVLTENDAWKELLIRWEIVSELVTLLRELDASIPKAPLGATPTAQTVAEAEIEEQLRVRENKILAPVAVERPYDTILPEGDLGPDDNIPASEVGSPSQGLDNQDPCEFEWRNLKKLVVLVLSSLVWKSTIVQDQIRHYGGVEMVLNCCNFDANNPYIKEHAIMCLRFLLERNKANQDIVDELQARKVVPNEVLHKKGYETYIDEQGKVGLRRIDDLYELEGNYSDLD